MSRFWVVMLAQPWSALRGTGGQSVRLNNDNAPEFFLPVFTSESAAIEWADGAPVVELMGGPPAAGEA
jgi:hypothetical protein